MISQPEWKKIEKLFKNLLTDLLQHVATKKDLQYFVTKTEFQDEIKKLSEKINHLPTKKDYYDREDKTAKELQDMRDDVAIIAGYRDQIEDHETRILRLEQRKSVL